MTSAEKKSSKSPKSLLASAGPPGLHSYFLAYPTFCVGTDDRGLLVTGGGGGGKAYGVMNYLQAHGIVGTNSDTGDCSIETIATMDTGSEAPISVDYADVQGGLWAAALDKDVLLFKFNDDLILLEQVFKWTTGNGGSLNFAKFDKSFTGTAVASSHTSHHIPLMVTGGEDKHVKLWRIDQRGGPGTSVSGISLVTELTDHIAEVTDADFVNGKLCTCGKDGTVFVYQVEQNGVNKLCSIKPVIPGVAPASGTITIRGAYFTESVSSVVLMCHFPRGPTYLMSYALSSPETPVAIVSVSKSICTSFAINKSRTKVAFTQVGGQKEIFNISSSSIKAAHRSHKQCHEMPPGKCAFIGKEEMVVSASPDFSINFFNPAASRSTNKCLQLALIILLFLVLVVAYLLMFVPGYVETLVNRKSDEL